MTQTREIPFPKHCGCDDVVITQEMKNGHWIDTGIRKLSKDTMISDIEPGLTGSSNNHARLSPSDSKRWTQCTAAIAFQEANGHRVRKDDGSEYSEQGTNAHEWAAKVLMGQCQFDDVPETDDWGDDLRVHVKDYVEHCLCDLPTDAARTSINDCVLESELDINPPDVAFFVEEQVPLYYQPEQTGTADFLAVVARDGVVERFIGKDYKHGAGVLVTSDENTQLAIYIYSAIKLLEGVYQFGPETLVSLRVFQPRHREGADQECWTLTLADLASFCTGHDSIEYAAIQAREGANRVREKIGAPGRDVSPEEILEAAPMVKFHPQDGDEGSCRWCKCKAWCPKRYDAATEGMDIPNGMSTDELLAAMPDLDKDEKKQPVIDRIAIRMDKLGEYFLDNGAVIPDAWLVQLLRKQKQIESFLGDVREYLEGRLLDGETIPGTKLVEGREGNRQWANEKDADTFLTGQKISADDRYTKTLVSPTVAEKLLKGKDLSARAKSRFKELVTRSAAQKKIALDDDDRKAVPSAVAAMPDLDDSLDGFEV